MLASAIGMRRIHHENWPNDEGFVSTDLEQSGFTCKNLKEIVHTRFDKFSTTVPLYNRLDDYEGIAHPVLSWNDFCAKFSDRAVKAIRAGRADTYFKKSLENLNDEELNLLIQYIQNQQ